MSQGITLSARVLGVAALASVTAGLVAGIGARIIMRIVALISHMPPLFTIATLNILLDGIVFGFAAGFLLTLLTIAVSASPKARKYVPGPIWRGLIWGVLLLLVALPLLFGSEAEATLVGCPAIPTDLALGIPLLNRCMFGALIIIYGITLGIAEKLFDHILPRKPTSTKTDIPTSI